MERSADGGALGEAGGAVPAGTTVFDDEIPGVVVSRINLSARFMRELIDAMQDNYSKWQTREGIKNLPEFGGGAAASE